VAGTSGTPPPGSATATPRPHPRRLAGAWGQRAGPAQPPRQRWPLPLAAWPGPGEPARGPRGPADAAATPPAAGQPEPAKRVPPGGAGPPLRQQALAAELAILAQARPHSRNRTLNRCAFKVYRYVAGGLLDDQETTTALTTVARSIGLGAAEVRRTLASARTAARAFPRGLPARPEEGGA
jgi:hypothetical protein